MLQSMGLQRVGYNLVMEQQQQYIYVYVYMYIYICIWAVAHQAPLSMGFSRQEYWSRLSFFS